jgi:molybdopterin-guanine dinucleotide biosynthesis protein MobB
LWHHGEHKIHAMSDKENMKPPVVGIVAYQKNAGKTMLLKKLIRLARERRIRVAVIKHAHHSFDIDHAGKDSYEMRSSGAVQVLVASRKRWALMTETPDNEHDPPLSDLTARLDLEDVDLVLVEGLRHEPIPKIEVHRADLRSPFMFPDDETIVAVVSDSPDTIDTTLPRLDSSRPDEILTFIEHRILSRRKHASGDWSRAGSHAKD